MTRSNQSIDRALAESISISPQATSLEPICKAAVDEIRARHPERIFRLESSGELHGQFDGERLQQALGKLLDNAVRHGSGSEPITLRAYGEPDRVTVQVRNLGGLIPADQLQVIFGGRGLYIASEIVKMHGGTIVAESSVRDGTVFSAHLPRALVETAGGYRAAALGSRRSVSVLTTE